jgi:hypothetical protein
LGAFSWEVRVVYVLVRMKDALRTVYSMMVENAGEIVWAIAAFTTFSSQDMKGARVPLLSDPVIISCPDTPSKHAHLQLSIYIYEAGLFISPCSPLP